MLLRWPWEGAVLLIIKAPTAMSQGPQKPETSHTPLLMVPAVCFHWKQPPWELKVHNTSLPRVPDLSELARGEEREDGREVERTKCDLVACKPGIR